MIEALRVSEKKLSTPDLDISKIESHMSALNDILRNSGLEDEANLFELKSKDFRLLQKVDTVDLLGLNEAEGFIDSYDANKDVTISFID